MATTKFRGPVNSVKGFKFHPTNWTSARSMTVTATTLLISEAASTSWSATITNAMAGGLSKIEAGWANIRQSAAATAIHLCVRPLGAGNSCVLNAYENLGTGQKMQGRGATVTVFMLGYVS